MNAAAEDTYGRLARALDALPNGYPATPSGVEVELLAALIPLEPAAVAAVLGYEPRPVEDVAVRAGVPLDEAARRLEELAGMSVALHDGAGSWRLAPFWPGIWDALVPTMDRATAELVERFMAEGGARGIMGAEPPIGRVLPAPEATRADWILPYDDVRRVLQETAAVTIIDCVCRLERATLGAPCDYPTHICMTLHDEVPQQTAGLVSKAEALRLLDEADRLGLVHVATNVAGGWEFICHCCGCCCQFLRALTEWDAGTSVVSNYRAVVDAAACSGCGTCVERCQVEAIALGTDVAVVDAGRCIGCGVCVTGCPDEAVTLERLPEARITPPPADLEAWGEERLRKRDSARHLGLLARGLAF
ncbi:MAG: 4Fe-4S binding protein [Actinomycetes bacterium]